jgi:aspartyl/asparaginyl-tRNA synthetase
VKASRVFLGVFLLLGAAALAQEGTSALRPEDVGKDQAGKKIAVEGRVYSSSKTNVGIHLYFSADTSTAFQAIVPASAIYKFKVDIVKKYDKRNVRVTGKVEEESGKFYIRIEDPGQIKVVAHKLETS